MPTRQKIIVVDDSEICRDTAQLMLEEAGFEVITLGSPLGFSKTLLAEKPHLALVDVSMPALKGNRIELVELTEAVKELRTVPVEDYEAAETFFG